MATNNMKSNLWTEEEINLLKNLNSKNMSIRDMADFFDNKTLKQVDYKYKYLFTQKQRKNTNKNRKWLDEEIQILKDNYYKSYDELLKLLPKRKKDGIKKKLALLGIKRKKNGMHKGRELEVVELLKTNIVADVVKKTGLSRKAVNQIIKKYNVTPVKPNQWYAVDVDIEEETDISVTIHLEKIFTRGNNFMSIKPVEIESKIKRVALYLRLFRGEGLDDLNTHERRLVRKCDEHNWSYEMYKEIGSGSTIKDRPVIQQLLNDVERELFDAVVVVDLDRLSRGSGADNDRILYALKTSNTLVVVESPYQILDANNESDEDMIVFKGMIARMEFK